MMGQKKIARFAMNLDGSKKKTIYEYGTGSSSVVYDLAFDDPEHIYA